MKELFLIKDTLANKISYYHLMLYLLSLPFDRFYSHLILISFAVHTIIQFNKNNKKPFFPLYNTIAAIGILGNGDQHDLFCKQTAGV